MKVDLDVIIFREGKQYVAYCPTLDLSSCGATSKQAVKRFHEATELFFEGMEEMGTTGKVLRSLGWKKARRSWTPPRSVMTQTASVAIPA